MTNKSFAHLHVHATHSQLDGHSKHDELVAAARADGQPGISLTDHGNLHGLVDMYKECAKHDDIKFIPGIEAYFCDDRFVKETIKQENANGLIDGSDKRYYHLTLLAENNIGYHNLLKISSDAFINGAFYKPRTDWSMLESHSEGLIATTGCLGGVVLQKLLHGDTEGATAAAARLQDIFGRDNLFIELMNHNIPEQLKTNPQLIEISKRLNAPLVATNDSHYTKKEHHTSHDALLCQPPGTKVQVIRRTSRKGLARGSFIPDIIFNKNIEDVEIGDIVVSWNPTNRRGSMVSSGSRVSKVASREYSDDLIVVQTPSGSCSKYTKDHITVARTDHALDKGNYIVYLMSRGDSYRIGTTQYRKTYSNNTIGPVVRTKENNAESVWILGVYETDHKAREMEAYLSWKYQIPTWSFTGLLKKGHEPRTPYYDSLWERVGDLTQQAKKCLEDHGKMIEYPFFSRSQTPYSTRRPMFVRACNLESGMHVCEPGQKTNSPNPMTNEGSNAWQPIKLTKEYYAGPVYSMDVEKYETYVADGIVTHNCCQVGAQISDTDRFRFHGEEHYLKSAAEMRSLFSETESACDNTLWIANRSNVTLDFKTLHLPKFPVPEGYKDDNEFLIELVSKGLKIRYGDNPSEEVYDRAAYELSVIQSLNLSSYFLIFWDIVNFTKRERILTGPGRGSSAGSIVAYALEITKVEPLKHDLIFERFINPDRVALADIDYDVTSADRDKIVQYVRDTYGQEYVAQVITFSKIKARSAVRDAARVLGYKPAKGNDIVKVMPPLIMGVSTPLHACFTKEPQYEAGYANAQGLRELYESDPDTKEIVDVALGLEGLVRQDGVHAAGTVIGDRPLVELVPLQQRKNKDGTLGPIVTQYEKNTIEELGLLKMDFLALKNLDIIKQCLDYMGEELEYLDTMTYDDLETYAMLRRGEGIAVFQVESGPMRQLMIRLAPTDIGDIAAILALYRPGPMAANMHNDYADRKNGRQAISYFHPDAKPILEKYQGLMYFQESVMQVAQKFAGYSASEADNLRKIMGKKLPEKMKAEKEKFVNGCNATGYSQIGESLFHLIEAFASYGFPAGHAFGYAYITYWTAYLKCHFPREYMAAVCSGCMEGSDSLDKTARYLGETRRMGMKVYPPDLNSSSVGYSVAEDGIRIGLGTLAHMSIETVTKLIEIRDEKPFDGLYDFAFRVNPNVQAFRSLAYSGALDIYGTRQGIATTADEILKISRKDKKKANQINLFDVEEVVDFNIPTTEYGWHELLNREKETMGIFASGHPLDSYTEEKTNRDILTIQESEENKVHDVLVIITDVKTKYTKAQKVMATVTIEDQTGAVEMVVFPKSWEDYGSFMIPGRILKVTLKTGTDFRDERNYVMMSAEEVESQIAQANMVKQFGVYLPKGYNSDPKRMSALKGVLLQNHGNVLADIYISRSTKLNLGNEYLVNPTQKLKDEINNLFVQYKEVN